MSEKTEKQTSQPQFPTFEATLPSRGKLYSPDNPLSEGKVEMKYGSTREEDILTSQSLIAKKTVLDKLLNSLIINKSIRISDLILGDKNALLVSARIATYGAEYDVDVTCPRCTTVNKNVHINLAKLNEFKIDEGVSQNQFETELPLSKKKIVYKLLTDGDAKELEIISKRTSKNTLDGSDNNITMRLIQSIISIDGEEEVNKIAAFVLKEMTSIDSKALRDAITRSMPDIDMTHDFVCIECFYEGEVAIPIEPEFFWPTTQR